MKKISKPLFTGIILILIYTRLNNSGAITLTFNKFFSFFSIFIYGGIIAFLLNPILKFLEKNKKIKRKYSISILYFTLILLLGLFFSFIIPRLTRNIADLIENYPKYISIFENSVDKYRHLLPFLKDINILNELLLLQQKSLIFLQQEFSFLIGQFLGVTAKIISLVFSLIFSIFFLGNKEYFHKLTKDILDTFLSENTSNKVSILSKKIERVFLGYLSGKTLDSIIIGGIAMIGLSVLNIPYVILLGIFITLFNFIPYVGPFIGIVLGATIALFANPNNTILVIIFLALLQQFDAWVLEPKILGNSLNLSMFWTIAAVTLGGSVWGALGIIIAIPSFALIKELYLIKNTKEKPHDIVE
ncbi:MAG: AI-2E family transporter [Psychrilyobacter sp.]|uniref:AI-2E family transporter n=1 Tax=Psychrilyobacter sp. TaxID=2586924 RepID=UPI003C7488A6